MPNTALRIPREKKAPQGSEASPQFLLLSLQGGRVELGAERQGRLGPPSAPLTGLPLRAPPA